MLFEVEFEVIRLVKTSIKKQVYFFSFRHCCYVINIRCIIKLYAAKLLLDCTYMYYINFVRSKLNVFICEKVRNVNTVFLIAVDEIEIFAQIKSHLIYFIKI